MMARTADQEQMIEVSRAHLRQDRDELNHLSQEAWDNAGELNRRFELIDGSGASEENIAHIQVAEAILTQLRGKCNEMRRMQRQIDKRAEEHRNGRFR